MPRSRKKERDSAETPNEEKEYRSLAGVLMYLENSVVPKAALVTSFLKQKLGSLRVSHLIEANEMLHEIINFKPSILYTIPNVVSEA